MSDTTTQSPRVAACVVIEPDAGPLGLPPAHARTVLGRPAVRHVLEALGRARTVHARILASPRPGTVDRAWLEGLTGIEVLERETSDVPDRPWVRRSRLWSRDSWRGGLFGTSAFDEEGPPALLEAAARAVGADLLVRVPSTAIWLDPERLDRLVEQHLRVRESFEVAFTRSPPGLAGESYTAGVLEKMARLGRTPREMLAYKPQEPLTDPAKKPCCLHLPEAVVRTRARLLTDTGRGARLAGRLGELGLAPGRTPDTAIARALAENPSWEWEEGPGSATVQVLRADGFPEGVAGTALARLPEAAFAAAEAWAGKVDDLTVTLDALGDPLDHPLLPSWVGRLRAAGALGVAVHSPGGGSDAAWDALLTARPDLVEIRLDGDGTAADGPAAARAAWILARSPKERGGPLLVVSREKRTDREALLEPFVDGWLARGAWPVVRPYATWAGARPDLAPVRLLPAARHPCLRVRRDLFLRADGTVGACVPDLTGTLGRAPASADLGAAWNAGPAGATRAVHAGEDWGNLPSPCPRCTDWDRL